MWPEQQGKMVRSGAKVGAIFVQENCIDHLSYFLLYHYSLTLPHLTYLLRHHFWGHCLELSLKPVVARPLCLFDAIFVLRLSTICTFQNAMKLQKISPYTQSNDVFIFP